MRKIIVFTCLTFAVAGMYLGWIYYSRWKDSKAFIQRLEEPAAARERAFADAYGRGAIKIMSFYAVPSIIRLGDKAQLCYSVANADTVRIEPPPADEVWPSLSRCVNVSPGKDTVYRLVAKDAQENEKTAAIPIAVRSE
jgi:hypothetical protein